VVLAAVEFLYATGLDVEADYAEFARQGKGEGKPDVAKAKHGNMGLGRGQKHTNKGTMPFNLCNFLASKTYE
jgi:hypothetical protein